MSVRIRPVHFENPAVTGGFTLVEVLVSVLILAIGLIGMAGLQATALRHNHNAYLRSQATQLANDLADRIRANPVGLSSYTLSESNDNCEANACTPAQMAGYDLRQWNAALAAQLPGGKLVGCKTPIPGECQVPDGSCVCASGAVYSITISWLEQQSGGTSTTTFVTSMQPRP